MPYFDSTMCWNIRICNPLWQKAIRLLHCWKNILQSIHQPKHPHRNPILPAHFDVVDGQVTVVDVGDLAKVLAAAAYFEKIAIVQHEIASFWHGQFPDGGQLVGEECLPACVKVHRA